MITGGASFFNGNDDVSFTLKALIKKETVSSHLKSYADTLGINLESSNTNQNTSDPACGKCNLPECQWCFLKTPVHQLYETFRK